MNSGVGSEEYFLQSYMSRDWRFYKSLLSQVIAMSDPGPMLDLGAGCGYFVEACHRYGLSCVGLEGSKEAVGMAHKRYPLMDVRQFLLSERLPFQDESFAVVLMNQVIEHLEPSIVDNCAAEVYRVLRPGGVFIILSPSKFNKHEVQADPTHINMYSPSELKTLLVSNGFGEIILANSPLPLLGKNRLSRFIMFLLFRVTNWERLSGERIAIPINLINTEGVMYDKIHCAYDSCLFTDGVHFRPISMLNSLTTDPNLGDHLRGRSIL